jgi:hypothetical protein
MSAVYNNVTIELVNQFDNAVKRSTFASLLSLKNHIDYYQTARSERQHRMWNAFKVVVLVASAVFLVGTAYIATPALEAITAGLISNGLLLPLVSRISLIAAGISPVAAMTFAGGCAFAFTIESYDQYRARLRDELIAYVNDSNNDVKGLLESATIHFDKKKNCEEAKTYKQMLQGTQNYLNSLNGGGF